MDDTKAFVCHGQVASCTGGGGMAVGRHSSICVPWILPARCVGCAQYNALYGYTEKQRGAKRAEQIPVSAPWMAYDVDRWEPTTVRMRCVDPDAKTVAVVPPANASAAVPPSASTTAAQCSRIGLSGWARCLLSPPRARRIQNPRATAAFTASHRRRATTRPF